MDKARDEHHCRYCRWDVFPLAHSVEPVKHEPSELERQVMEAFAEFQRLLFAGYDRAKMRGKHARE